MTLRAFVTAPQPICKYSRKVLPRTLPPRACVKNEPQSPPQVPRSAFLRGELEEATLTGGCVQALARRQTRPWRLMLHLSHARPRGHRMNAGGESAVVDPDDPTPPVCLRHTTRSSVARIRGRCANAVQKEGNRSDRRRLAGLRA